MARSRQGTSAAGRRMVAFGRCCRYAVELSVAAFTDRLARLTAEAVDDGGDGGWPLRPVAREQM